MKRAFLFFQVDPDEKLMLEERARRRGWPTSHYVRQLVNLGLEQEEGDEAPAIGEDRKAR